MHLQNPEYNVGGTPIQVVLKATDGRTKVVTAQDLNGAIVYGGDMILATVNELATLQKAFTAPHEMVPETDLKILGHMAYGARLRWTGGRVPFVIDPAIPAAQQADITAAVQHWNTNTNIMFAVRAGEANFVTFRPAAGCSANVGMIGGQQFVNLAANCSRGNIIHEMGHTIGLMHEQQRSDRDNYVQINSQNIQANQLSNFDKTFDDGDIGPYDYGSVMHYDAFAFAINPTTPTIISPQPIGQRNGLSTLDINIVQFWYFTTHATIVNATPAVLNALFPINTYEGLHIAASRFARNSDPVAGAMPTHRMAANGTDHELIQMPRGTTFRMSIPIAQLINYFDTSTREGLYVACHRWGRANNFLSAYPDFEIGPNGDRGVYCILKGAGNNYAVSNADLGRHGAMNTIEDLHKVAHAWALSQGHAAGFPYFEQSPGVRGITCLNARV